MKNSYKTLSLAIIFIALFSLTGLSQNAWINEIHYDDIVADTNEFIEVAIENPGSYALSSFSVVLYNGNNGKTYDTKTLDEFTPGASSNGFTLFYYMFPLNGIQNGMPDGLALVYNDAVIPGQFLSYEGSFAAVDGPASGMTSVDILVFESGELEGLSIQLSGTGSAYSAFTWQMPAAETHGQFNNDQQMLPVGIEVPNELNFVLYPNPNRGIFTLINPVRETVQITLYSSIGQKISEYTLTYGENKLSLELARGIYYLVLSDQENTLFQTNKIVIN